MKLKFYLIGFGMGALLATAILIISGGLNKTDMTDDEIMVRARQLGMVESSSRLIDPGTQGNAYGANTEKSATSVVGQNTGNNQNSGMDISSAADVQNTDAETDASADQSGEENGEESTANEGAETNRGTGIVGEDNSVEAGGQTGEDSQQASSQQAGSQQATSQSVEASNSKSEPGTESSSGTGANTSSGQVIVTVPDGLYSEGVSELLAQAGAIDDAAAFNNYLIQSGRDRYITPGAKLIPAASTYEDVAKILSGK